MKFEPKKRLTYYIIRPLLIILLPIFYNVRCYGRENVPKDKNFILAGNHIGNTDPAILVALCPRVCHFMAKSEIFKNIFLAFFFRSMNAFPVKRGKKDGRAVEYAIKVINKGYVLGIFPEGGTSRDRLPKRAKSGVAYIAMKTGADVLPVSIYITPGERRIRPRLTVRFGKIIKNEEFGFSEEYSLSHIRDGSKLIMDSIVELWDKKHERDENDG